MADSRMREARSAPLYPFVLNRTHVTSRHRPDLYPLVLNRTQVTSRLLRGHVAASHRLPSLFTIHLSRFTLHRLHPSPFTLLTLHSSPSSPLLSPRVGSDGSKVDVRGERHLRLRA